MHAVVDGAHTLDATRDDTVTYGEMPSGDPRACGVALAPRGERRVLARACGPRVAGDDVPLPAVVLLGDVAGGVFAANAPAQLRLGLPRQPPHCTFFDKTIGTYHALPKGRAAPYTGSLSVAKFLTTPTYQRIDADEGVSAIAPHLADISRAIFCPPTRRALPNASSVS